MDAPAVIIVVILGIVVLPLRRRGTRSGSDPADATGRSRRRPPADGGGTAATPGSDAPSSPGHEGRHDGPASDGGPTDGGSPGGGSSDGGGGGSDGGGGD